MVAEDDGDLSGVREPAADAEAVAVAEAVDEAVGEAVEVGIGSDAAMAAMLAASLPAPAKKYTVRIALVPAAMVPVEKTTA